MYEFSFIIEVKVEIITQFILKEPVIFFSDFFLIWFCNLQVFFCIIKTKKKNSMVTASGKVLCEITIFTEFFNKPHLTRLWLLYWSKKIERLSLIRLTTTSYNSCRSHKSNWYLQKKREGIKNIRGYKKKKKRNCLIREMITSFSLVFESGKR